MCQATIQQQTRDDSACLPTSGKRSLVQDTRRWALVQTNNSNSCTCRNPGHVFAGAVASQVQPSTQQEQARKARNSTAHVSGHLVCPKSALCDATGSYTAAAATPAANTCNPSPSMGTSHQQCQVLYNTTARERIRAKTLCETYKRQPSMRALCV